MFFRLINTSFKLFKLMFVWTFYAKWLTQTEKGGKYFKKSLINLDILGIKLGQFLQNDKKVLSPEVQKIFEELLDDINEHSFLETKNIIKACDENNYLKNNLEYIDKNVVGSGSVGQVHQIKLKNNEEKLCIKVKHPSVTNLDKELKVFSILIYLF